MTALLRALRQLLDLLAECRDLLVEIRDLLGEDAVHADARAEQDGDGMTLVRTREVLAGFHDRLRFLDLAEREGKHPRPSLGSHDRSVEVSGGDPR